MRDQLIDPAERRRRALEVLAHEKKQMKILRPLGFHAPINGAARLKTEPNICVILAKVDFNNVEDAVRHIFFEGVGLGRLNVQRKMKEALGL